MDTGHGAWLERLAAGPARERSRLFLVHAVDLGCRIEIPPALRTDYLNVAAPVTSRRRGRVASVHVRSGSVEFQGASWDRLGAPAGFRRLVSGQKAAISLLDDVSLEKASWALERELDPPQ